jgi:phosphopantetheinyl transferase (holo-ACP synthase)
LRRENKRLREEREILSKAAAWFAKEADSKAEAFGVVMANRARNAEISESDRASPKTTISAPGYQKEKGPTVFMP